MTTTHLPSCRRSRWLPIGGVKTRNVDCLVAITSTRRKTLNPALRLFSLLIGLLISATLPAQTFDELETALKSHPQLRSMSHQAFASRERADSVMALPDPVVSIGINNFPVFDPSFTEFLPTNKALGIQQRFPSRVSREARSKMNSAEADRYDVQYQQTYAALRAELIALLHTKQRIAQQRSLAQQRNAKYDQLIEAIESAVRGGRSPVFRLPEIESERAEVAHTLVDLDAELAQVGARLTYLVGEIPITNPPQSSLSGWSGDPMVFYASRVADAGVKLSNSEVEEAKSAWKAEWGAQFTYQQREAGVNFAGDDWVSMMFTITVPFWAKGKQAPQLRAAEAQQSAAQARLDDAKRLAVAQYTYSSSRYQAAGQAITILQQKMGAIRSEMAIQQGNYESGVGDYSAIIDAEIAILKLRADIAAQQARLGIAAAQLDALMVTQ